MHAESSDDSSLIYFDLICQHLSFFGRNSTFYLKPNDQNDLMSPFILLLFRKHLPTDFWPLFSLHSNQ